MRMRPFEKPPVSLTFVVTLSVVVLFIQHFASLPPFPVSPLFTDQFVLSSPCCCPTHKMNIVAQPRGSSGFPLSYLGNIFHRVVPKFMAQGGDITREDGRCA